MHYLQLLPLTFKEHISMLEALLYPAFPSFLDKHFQVFWTHFFAVSPVNTFLSMKDIWDSTLVNSTIRWEKYYPLVAPLL